MSNAQKGFGSMDKAKQREIASKGGKAAHAQGTAHEFTPEEGRAAGRKGGMARHRRLLEPPNLIREGVPPAKVSPV